MRPSRSRRVLALYLDFLVFEALFAPTAWVIERAGVPRPGFVAKLLVFVLLRVVVVYVLRGTPGKWAVGIQSHDEDIVDEAIRQREAWWTMLAGVLLVLEGSKNLVRWTQGLPPPPLAGPAIPEEVAFAFISLLGLLNVSAGVSILRAQWSGVVVAMAVLAVQLFSLLAYREAFHAWTARAVVARRELQGLAVRAGEVDFMQTALSLAPAVIGLSLLWLAAVAVRLRALRTATVGVDEQLGSQ